MLFIKLDIISFIDNTIYYILFISIYLIYLYYIYNIYLYNESLCKIIKKIYISHIITWILDIGLRNAEIRGSFYITKVSNKKTHDLNALKPDCSLNGFQRLIHRASRAFLYILAMSQNVAFGHENRLTCQYLVK